MSPAPLDFRSPGLLQLVLDNMEDLVLIVDRDGRRLYSNPSYDRRLGNLNSLPGGDLFREIHPDDRDRVKNLVREACDTGTTDRTEYRHLSSADGTICSIQSRAYAIRGSSGNPEQVLIISRDVTAYRLAHKANYRSQLDVQEIFEQSSDLIIIIDANHVVIHGSPSVERVLGYRADEYSGRRFITLLDPDEVAQVAQVLQKALENPGRAYSLEHRMQHRLGAWRMFESMLKAVTDDKGNVSFIISARDITERNRAEQFLQETNYTLQSLIRTSPLAIIATDFEFKVKIWNKAATQMFGWTEQEVIGDSLPPALRRLWPASHSLDSLVTGGASPAETEIQLQRRNRSIVDTSVWTTALRNSEGVVVGLISICADLTERKQAKAALHASERKFKELVELLPQCVFECGIDGSILFANEYAYTLFGGSREVSAALPNAYLTLAATDRPRARRNFLRMFSGEQVGETVYSFLKCDGTAFPGVLYASPIMHHGRCTGLRGVIIDLSAQKETEKMLREAESKFRHMVERSPVGVYIVQEGRFSYVNPRFAEIFGYPQDEILTSRTMLDLVAETDRALVAGSMRRHLQDGVQTLDYVFRGLRKDGSQIDLEAYGSRTEYAGRPAVICTLLDITQRKRTEAERARLSSAVEQAAEAIVITDPAGTILYVNPAFERITGYARELAIGQNPRILKSGKQGGDFYEEMWSRLVKGEVWSGTLTNRRKDNSLYEEEMVISPVRDESGRVVNYVAVKRDVTHQLEMERQLSQSQKMESLGQLAGGIAHDFNNVLSIIGGTLMLLRKKFPDEQLRRYIEMGEAAVNRGADIARRLLTFSRDEMVQLRPLSLGDLVRELCGVLDSLIEKTVVVTASIPPGLPPVRGDHGQLYQVLLNLCINARDAILDPSSGKKGGTITICATPVAGNLLRARLSDATEDQYVHLSVRDTGTGMAENVKQRIFDPFFTTKPRGKGTGLGLSVVYGILKSHHGMIEVESQPGQGSTFHVYLPACNHQPQATRKHDEGTITGGTETILVVEDETSQRMLLTELLQMHGYRILPAADGIEGFEAYKQNLDSIAAVITDIGLPRLSGEDLARKIKELNPSARVIMASGYLEPNQSARLHSAGVRASIHKPFHGTNILKLLRGVLDENPDDPPVSSGTEESDPATEMAV